MHLIRSFPYVVATILATFITAIANGEVSQYYTQTEWVREHPGLISWVVNQTSLGIFLVSFIVALFWFKRAPKSLGRPF
jgi:hypothetical protein